MGGERPKEKEGNMRALVYAATAALLCATAACSSEPQKPASVPFDNGLRTNLAQPTTCSPADQSCGYGVGNPAVNSPIQKRVYTGSGQ